MKHRHYVVFVEYALLAGMIASTTAIGVVIFQGKLRALFRAIIETVVQT